MSSSRSESRERASSGSSDGSRGSRGSNWSIGSAGSLLVEKMTSLAQLVRSKPDFQLKLVNEIAQFATVVLDLDGTLAHTLVDPAEIVAAQRSALRAHQLPGKMGLLVERPGLQELFASLLGYNVVIYSAGGSCYVNIAIKRLVEENPIMQGKICKILCQKDLVRYSLLSHSEVPSNTPLSNEGIYYCKDLSKAREDGDSQKVLIVDDNPYAFQVVSYMRDADFKNLYNFTPNALPVTDFKATNPKAAFDTSLARIGQVFDELVSTADIVAALKDRPHLAELVALDDGQITRSDKLVWI